MKNSEFVFPITYGRSGSTLLMGILNSIEGYTITGENDNAFYELMKFHKKMYRAHMSYRMNSMPRGCRNSWWNTYTDMELDEQIRQITKNLIDKDARVVGFKEIRYPNMMNTHELGHHLNWMSKIYNPKFIFLTRNLEDTCHSAWFVKNPERCTERLNKFESYMYDYIDKHVEQDWIHITYEQLCKNNLRELFEFLDEPYYPEALQKNVLEVLYGYKNPNSRK
jgi:hypothetical protein